MTKYIFTHWITRRRAVHLFAILLTSILLAGFRECNAQENGSERNLDVVFCLDLSGSTNGLLDNVRENIWGIVNLAESMQPRTRLRIGVVGYSRPSFGRNDFYVKTISRLTDDFDRLVVELYKLKAGVEKGDQYVSNALEVSGLNMNWSRDPQSVKMLFLVGNGNVDTGSSDYRSVADEIRENGISLVPVYCLRQRQLNDEMGWELIGRVSGIPYETIWATKRDPFVVAGQDKEQLMELHRQLNRLVVPTGKEGQRAYEEMKSCDNRAMLYLPHNYEDRLYHRISSGYLDRMAEWDMISDERIGPGNLPEMDEKTVVADSIRTMDGKSIVSMLEKTRAERIRVLKLIREKLPLTRQTGVNGILLGDGLVTEHVLERVVLMHIIKQCGLKGMVPAR